MVVPLVSSVRHTDFDLGGIHTIESGSVLLNDAVAESLGLIENGMYEIAVFHAERQSLSSTFQIRLAGFDLMKSRCTAE